MRTSSVDSPTPELPWRDAALVVAVTLLSIVLSARFELNEALFALTRHVEHFQLDELPIGMLVLMLGLIWLSVKRYRHAQRELKARRAAEATLEGVLRENRRLAREILRIQDVERRHLARELHDELGQYLNAIKLDAVSICDDGGAAAAPVAEHAAVLAAAHAAALAIIHSVDHVHAVVSDMIGRLRPAGLDELGLPAAIEHCVDHWRRRLPATRFALSIEGNCDDLGETLNLTVYRLVQEGLTNIHKHAHAAHVAIVLERAAAPGGGPDQLRISVADDGRGMEPKAGSTRFGLSGMRERVAMAGGSFTMTTAPGGGLRFEACLPLTGEPQ